jgi:hypothetical protein
MSSNSTFSAADSSGQSSAPNKGDGTVREKTEAEALEEEKKFYVLMAIGRKGKSETTEQIKLAIKEYVERSLNPETWKDAVIAAVDQELLKV